MDGFLRSSATRMVAALAAKDVSSEELTGAVIARIEAVNPRLNAVMALDADRALESARAADARRARGEDIGPLQGLPMTVKDSFETAGIVSTAGTPGRRGFVPDRDATVVARLRTAGAIVVGKTSTPELTLRFETENRLIGRTSNPYDLRRTPGGSSGGAAALVAAGASPFDIGSDTGGSIRIPAHFCGIAGLKPTAGRVSRAGHVPHLEFPLAESFTQIGPLARRVEDLALILPLIAGADPCDPFIVPMPRSLPPDAVTIAGLRVAFYAENGRTPADAGTHATLATAIGVLAEAGATLHEGRPPGTAASTDLWRELFLADGGAGVRAALARYGTAEPDPLIAWTAANPPAEPGRLMELLDQWSRLKCDGLAFLETADCILCPVNAEPAPVAGEAGPIDYTYHYNLLGWPAAVVRCGQSAAGLPIGLQIIAPPWREDLCLAVAALLEERLGGWQPPPV